jgi:hypothetical protein
MAYTFDKKKISEAADKLLGMKPAKSAKAVSAEADYSKLGKGKDTLGNAAQVKKGSVKAGKVAKEAPKPTALKHDIKADSIHMQAKKLAGMSGVK